MQVRVQVRVTVNKHLNSPNRNQHKIAVKRHLNGSNTV